VNNIINSDYPDIIWFNQGIYVISSFSSSLTGNNYSISIGGKDKMCLLNGDMGGSLPASIDFGLIDTYIYSYEPVIFEDELIYEANKYYTKNEKVETNKYQDTNIYYIKINDNEYETIIIKNELEFQQAIIKYLKLYWDEYKIALDKYVAGTDYYEKTATLT
jgi:hypothetical protein